MAIRSREATWYTEIELERLAVRGVRLPRPDQIAIRRDIPLDRIAPGARLHAFTRLTGAATRVDAGAEVGAGGPATLDNAWVGVSAQIGTLGPVTLRNTVCGPGTVLGCGVAEDAVFLGKESQDTAFTTGYGFRVRKGSLYEEDANSAQHTDTKMTVLFPWVTLGSNINWCDLLVSGGKGPGLGEFTEVGSGTIHFNFTPRGDKATASLLGNAADGVFLDRPRLFIGGNGSLIGPVQADFGAATLAGGRYARTLRPGLNALEVTQLDISKAFDLEMYGSIKRLFDSQVRFIGELAALDGWYGHARARIAQGHPDRAALYERARAIVRVNIRERISQIAALAGRMEVSASRLGADHPNDPRRDQHEALVRNWPMIEQHLLRASAGESEPPPAFRQALDSALEGDSERYTEVVRRLSPAGRSAGRGWLGGIRDRVASPDVLAQVPRL